MLCIALVAVLPFLSGCDHGRSYTASRMFVVEVDLVDANIDAILDNVADTLEIAAKELGMDVSVDKNALNYAVHMSSLGGVETAVVILESHGRSAVAAACTVTIADVGSDLRGQARGDQIMATIGAALDKLKADVRNVRQGGL